MSGKDDNSQLENTQGEALADCLRTAFEVGELFNAVAWHLDLAIVSACRFCDRRKLDETLTELQKTCCRLIPVQHQSKETTRIREFQESIRSLIPSEGFFETVSDCHETYARRDWPNYATEFAPLIGMVKTPFESMRRKIVKRIQGDQLSGFLALGELCDQIIRPIGTQLRVLDGEIAAADIVSGSVPADTRLPVKLQSVLEQIAPELTPALDPLASTENKATRWKRHRELREAILSVAARPRGVATQTTSSSDLSQPSKKEHHRKKKSREVYGPRDDRLLERWETRQYNNLGELGATVNMKADAVRKAIKRAKSRREKQKNQKRNE